MQQVLGSRTVSKYICADVKHGRLGYALGGKYVEAILQELLNRLRSSCCSLCSSELRWAVYGNRQPIIGRLDCWFGGLV